MKRAVVGVRELKARLSAYLRAVAAGETILVGDRRRQPFAQLAPLRQSKEALHVERLEREGLVRRGHGQLAARPARKKRSRRSIAAMVLEDRR